MTTGIIEAQEQIREDNSLDICKAQSYVDFVGQYLGEKVQQRNGYATLTTVEIDAIGWMLSDAGEVLNKMAC